MKTTVLLIEDHRLVREALRQALRTEPDIEVTGEAGDGAAGLQLARSLAPDVVVLDIALPDINGIELAGRLRQARSAVRLVALSAYADKRFVTGMLRAGANAYVTKASAGAELVRAIRAVAGDQSYLCPDVAGAVVSGVRDGDKPPLGRREREVLRLIAAGARSPEIARQLQISVSTVEVHRRNVMRKLGLHRVAELTRYAVREGLISP